MDAKTAYILHLLWWFTAMHLTQKNAAKVLSVINNSHYSENSQMDYFNFLSATAPVSFYSSCAFYSLLIKCDFLSRCFYFSPHLHPQTSCWGCPVAQGSISSCMEREFTKLGAVSGAFPCNTWQVVGYLCEAVTKSSSVSAWWHMSLWTILDSDGTTALMSIRRTWTC